MGDELPMGRDANHKRVSRRELARTLLAGLGAGVLPASLSLHPMHKHLLDGILLDSAEEALTGGSYQPAFLSRAQLASVDKLTEAIIPGSHQAQSAQFIDLLLSVDTAKHQEDFVASLSALDSAASDAFHQDTAQLNKRELQQLVEAASAKDSADYGHFENLKRWSAGAYYSSEMGMRELGWTPDRVFPTYPGCTHPENHA
jgi:hypothetical protein